MPRCAIYARFSSDRQAPTSAEDQIRVCRTRAEAEGWEVVDVYPDIAISGATKRRPQLTRMLSDVTAGRFDIVLAEALDRVARNQADVATIYQRLQYRDVRLVTLSEGDINELHIGLKGTMAALHLRDHSDKIIRGKLGALERGTMPGGNRKYGYDIVRRIGANGQLERGLRTINEEEAAIVRRIFTAYLDGQSTYQIAKQLNREGVPSASGGKWRNNTIAGTASRQDGILRCSIYAGAFVYGRRKHRRDPETDQIVVHTTEMSTRRVSEMPDMAIIDRDTWERTQAMLDARARLPLQARRRAKRLFAGLMQCGVCGSRYVNVWKDRLGCYDHRDAGTCTNASTVADREVNRRVLAGLRAELLAPEALALLVKEYHVGRERKARGEATQRAAAERRLKAIDGEISNLVSAVAGGLADLPEIRDAIGRRRAEKADLERELAELAAPAVIALHPQILQAYRERIEKLTEGDFTDKDGLDASAHLIRSLITSIVITPGPAKTCEIVVESSLDAVVRLAKGQPSRQPALERAQADPVRIT